MKEGKDLEFEYRNGKGELSSRVVSSVVVNSRYLQGYCHRAHAFRTFRLDRVLGTKDPILKDLCEHAKVFQESKEWHAGLEICFTGYKKCEKEKFKREAESRGFVVRASVTVNLDFLCCGPNAGSAKIASARKKGTCILVDKEVNALIETGEVPI